MQVNISPRLVADIIGPVTEGQVKSLFSIIPGMEYCDYREEQVSWGYKGEFLAPVNEWMSNVKQEGWLDSVLLVFGWASEAQGTPLHLSWFCYYMHFS